MQFFKALFDGNEKDINKYRKVVEKVNALESDMKKMSDNDLRAKTEELKAQVVSSIDAECEKRGKAWEDLVKDERRQVTDAVLDPLMVEAFAIVREAADRTLKMRPFDVQLIGGMVLHDGRIAEMKTGEGKTLTATLPIYLNALTGKGVHLVTVNDYLSKVGAVAMGPLYHFLGLSVGIIQSREGSWGGGSYVFDPEYRHSDARYDFARPVDSRHEAYACDITYGTNNEYGFDYLFDNLAQPDQELNQRELIFAIVDEVDSILIDEARTPLIISGPSDTPSDLYVKMDRIIRQLQNERDYKIEEKQKTAVFSEDGQKRVERALGVESLSDAENLSMMQHANAALKAHAVYKRDVDYLVKRNEEKGRDEVLLIDENTGRLMFGRRLSDGLHQAIEAKEGVKIEEENRTTATITYQNLFRLYAKLGGMTGTAKTEEDEFRKIYALDVVAVPTNRPMVRQDHPDLIFKSEEAKLRGIAREILTLAVRQQPILVGTRSVKMSERVSDRLRYDRLEMLLLADILRDKLENAKGLDKAKYSAWSAILNQKLTPGEQGDPSLTRGMLSEIARHFDVPTSMKDSANQLASLKLLGLAPDAQTHLSDALAHGIRHNILNAKSHEKEAKIISEAGRKGAVTIATNMAGRGVDILLGGTIVSEENSEEGADEYEYQRGGKPQIGLTPVGEKGSAAHQAEADDVRNHGGLFVIGCERHEARRIDNQLRGRAGRQGDPGASRFYVSLEDELWRLFGDKANSPLLAGWAEDQAIDAKILSRMIERAQKKVEMHYFDIRKHTLDYDDVMNVQREKIYGERRRIMEGAELRETIVSYLHGVIEGDLNIYAPANVAMEEWDMDGLFNSLTQYLPLHEYASMDDLRGKTRDQLTDFLDPIVDQAYADKEQQFSEMLGGEAGVAEMRDLERRITLQSLDRHWMEHLSNMEYLREGIGWRGYAGIDPLVLYKKEAYDMFQQVLQSVQDEVARIMTNIQINMQSAEDQMEMETHPMLMQGADEDGMGEPGAPEPVSAASPPLANGVSRADRRRASKSKGRR